MHLSRLLPLLAAQLLLVFQRHGAVDHNQVALAALQALGDDEAPTELALRLDYGIEHILVDEFQDTAINQYDLLGALTRGWGEHNAQRPQAPRTVMVVGDAMQSIYGFRGANVGLFLKARREGFNGVRLEPLELHSNFRSDAGVVAWINDTFAGAFPAREDINRGQVSFTAASAVRPAALQPAVAMHAFYRGDNGAAGAEAGSAEGSTEGSTEGQAQEVAFICAHIAALSRDAEIRSIAVLGRSRTHLQPVIAGLQDLGIAYSAAALDSLAHSPLVADLLTLCRALASRADRLAWLALLRAPWCGLQLADLLRLAQHGDPPGDEPVWNTLCDDAVRSRLSPDGRQRLAALLPVLRRAEQQRERLSLRVWIEQAWVGLGGPGTAVDCEALRDAESFFQLLEQADCEGVGLDPQWLSQAVEKQFMNSAAVDTRVQLMTLHRAKGLEFDCVIIPQLARVPRGDGRQLLLWDEHSSPTGERRFLLAADDHSAPGAPTLYNYLQRQRLEKNLLENTRLLYVGATRAIRQLTLSASLNWDEKREVFRAPAARSLLSSIWPLFEQQMIVHEPAAAAPPPQIPSTVRPLLRLRRDSAAPMPAAAPAAVPARSAVHTAQRNLPDRAANHLQRCVGSVVHLALEELSRRSQLPDACSAADHSRWRQALQCCGLWGAPLDAALAAVAAAMERSLAPQGAGRWLLDSAHTDARSEWALTWVDAQGSPRELVIDRTFVAPDTGIRWLIDYKTSRPLPHESVAQFAARESALYMEQLQRYRSALRALGDQPICCALFFAALGHLHHVVELDLPAG